jgi:protein-S-isoprenylcysteine O-methyltransferase Ste14
MDYDMSELSRRVAARFLTFFPLLAVLLFGSAGSLRYWEGWIYWTVYTGMSLWITLYFLKYDPRLIERRLEVGPHAEPRTSQKIIQGIASMLVIAMYVVSGLDWRVHGGAFPATAVLASDALVVLGFWIMYVVFRENRHAAGIVKVEPGQNVIRTGPYRVVRHPMYAGAFLMFLATPPALGSRWGWFVAALLCGMIVVRLLDEERFLGANLAGYEEYRRRVRRRLIPGIW